MVSQNPDSFRYESIHGSSKSHPKFSLLAGLVFDEFGSAALEDVLSDDTNATMLVCERFRRNRDNKVAVLALGYFSHLGVFVPYIADRSQRDTAHVAFFLDNLEQKAFDLDTIGAKVLTIKPGNLHSGELSNRGYIETTRIPGQTSYELSRQTYAEELARREAQPRPFGLE